MTASENFRPTLLVGVGGTGCKIAEAILEEARRNDSSIQNRIGILAIDTDENIKRELSHLSDASFLQISQPETVYRLIERNSEIEDDWCYRRGTPPMVEPVLSKSLIEGAGQLRLLTRLALYDGFKNHHMLEVMESALSKLTVHGDDQAYGGSIHILMVGSLAGATGSGSFAHVALALRQAARNRDAHASVRGVFLLPDVYVRSGVLKSSQHNNVLANGYASLKELNAINVRSMIKTRKADFDFEYLPGHEILDGSAPFEAMTFIDFENSSGGSMGRNPSAYVNMAARAGYLMIFSPIGAAYGSDVINDVRQGLAAVSSGTTNLYSGIGVAAIKYPVESMQKFLSRKLVVENLKGDWVRLDQSYRDQMERYRLDKDAGSSAAEEPNLRETYIKDLSQFAREEPRIPFFRNIYDELFPEVEDEKTFEKQVKPLHEEFVNATVDYVEREFWSEGDMRDIRQRLLQSLDSSSLLEGDSILDTVRRAESTLDGSFRTVEAALATRPDNIYQNSLVTADGLGVGEWASHHLQTFMVEKSNHPVAVRAFLYLVESEMTRKREEIDVRDLKLKLFRIANEFREDDEIESTNNRPETRSTPKIVEKATAASDGGGALNRLFGSKKKAFAEDYVDYYNRSIEQIRRYAGAVMQARVYDQALSEVNMLIRAFEGLFVEIEDIVGTLEKEIEVEKTKYSDFSSFDGNAFVYASAECKDDAWARLLSKAQGLGLATSVNKELVNSVYSKHRDDKRTRNRSGFKEINELFMKKVVSEFGEETIKNDYASVYDLSVIEAAEREFVVDRQSAEERAKEQGDATQVGADRDELLRILIKRASQQSEPYVSLSRAETSGANMKFWAVHPLSEEHVGNPQLFSEMFRSSDGSRPIVEDDYSKYELTCVHLKVNLELQHLSKIGMAEDGTNSVHARTEGRYAKAYGDMVQKILEAERSSNKAMEFTPHTDRRWHRPGALPEVFEELEQKISDHGSKAYVVAQLAGLLKQEDDEGDKQTRFSTVGFGLKTPQDAVLVSSHDAWRVYQAFSEHSALSRSAMDYWNLQQDKLAESEGTHPLIGKMTSAEKLLEILKISSVRNRDVEERDTTTQAALGAWMDLLQAAVDAQEASLTPKGRRNKFVQHVDDARIATLAMAKQEGYESQQLSVFERLFGLAYDNTFAG